MERKYGWKRQPENVLDLKMFSAGKPKSFILPDELDKRESPFYFPVYDQGNTSSCTGNGGARIFQYGLNQAGIKMGTPSRLWLYGNARKLEGDYNKDDGANIRDIMVGANKFGIIPETDWDFDEDKVTTPLPQELYDEAGKNKIHFYASINNTIVDAMRMCLFHDFLICGGSAIYDYFESKQMEKNMILHLPTASESFLGGHCYDYVGYDHPNRRFLCANSWGTSWIPSMRGHFWVDYDYVTSDLTSDLWMNRFK